MKAWEKSKLNYIYLRLILGVSVLSILVTTWNATNAISSVLSYTRVIPVNSPTQETKIDQGSVILLSTEALRDAHQGGLVPVDTQKSDRENLRQSRMSKDDNYMKSTISKKPSNSFSLLKINNYILLISILLSAVMIGARIRTKMVKEDRYFDEVYKKLLQDELVHEFEDVPAVSEIGNGSFFPKMSKYHDKFEM